MSLKYLAAYALISLNNSAPTKDDVSKVVSASGVKVDSAELDYVFEALKGKSVDTLIAEGQKKMTAAAPPPLVLLLPPPTPPPASLPPPPRRRPPLPLLLMTTMT